MVLQPGSFAGQVAIWNHESGPAHGSPYEGRHGAADGSHLPRTALVDNGQLDVRISSIESKLRLS